MALSAQEAVELVCGGGCRGATGSIECSEFYYNNESGSMIPSTNSWSGNVISQGDFTPMAAPNWLTGSATTPGFMCEDGKSFDAGTYGEVAGFSAGLARKEEWDSQGHIIVTYGTVFRYFDKDGNVLGDTFSGIDTELFANADDEKVYWEWCAGYNSNNDDYIIGLAIGDVETTFDPSDPTHIIDRRLYSSITPQPTPDSFITMVEAWGDGQKPQEDDGVTPTGGSGGGGGTYSRNDETVAIPGLPSLSVTDLGLSTLYHVSVAEIQSLGGFLWGNDFFDNIKKNQMSPMENIIALSILPTLNFSEGSAEIVIGNVGSNISSHKLLTSYYQVDCGTINVNEYYKNFADYETTLQIYLPFIGIKDVPIDDAMNGYIHVAYNVDCFTGSCVAFVQCQTNDGAWHVLQSHNGTINTSIPISGQNYMGVYQSILGAVGTGAGGIGAAMMGGPMGVAGGVSAMSSMASGLLGAKPSFMRSGNLGSMASLLGIRYPYLIFTTPQIFTAKTFRENKGYVSNLTRTISNMSGYLQCDPDKLDLTNLNMTEDERDMLYNELSNGVYI